MHTPIWIKIGMTAGFAFLALWTINAVGDMMGGSPDGHDETEHVADTAHTDAADVSTSHTVESPQDIGHETSADPAVPAEATDHTSDEPSVPTTDEGVEDIAEEVEVAALAGDAETGARDAKKKCGTCHSFGSGEKHKVGPNLFAVISRGRGVAEGYKYSANMKSMGGFWTDPDLDAYLTDPKAFVPGSKMTLKTKKEEDRANFIAYLHTLE